MNLTHVADSLLQKNMHLFSVGTIKHVAALFLSYLTCAAMAVLTFWQNSSVTEAIKPHIKVENGALL